MINQEECLEKFKDHLFNNRVIYKITDDPSTAHIYCPVKNCWFIHYNLKNGYQSVSNSLVMIIRKDTGEVIYDGLENDG